jgi:hypothetical protein
MFIQMRQTRAECSHWGCFVLASTRSILGETLGLPNARVKRQKKYNALPPTSNPTIESQFLTTCNHAGMSPASQASL